MTNPDAVTVLCYGDSNTYGYPAEQLGLERWPVDVRWTGRLQALLGGGYAVIEEGLRGRTTALDYRDPARAGCNGLTYLGPCVHSHDPIDVVMVMLGTNDVKIEFDQSPVQIAEALDTYIDVIHARATNQDGDRPAIVLVSPAHVDDTCPDFALRRGARYDHTSVEKSRQLAVHLRVVAETRGVTFVDAAVIARVGADGVHLSRDSHQPLADRLADTIHDVVAMNVAS